LLLCGENHNGAFGMLCRLGKPAPQR